MRAPQAFNNVVKKTLQSAGIPNNIKLVGEDRGLCERPDCNSSYNFSKGSQLGRPMSRYFRGTCVHRARLKTEPAKEEGVETITQTNYFKVCCYLV